MRQWLSQISYCDDPVRVFSYESIDSTNMELKRMGAPAGTVVCARYQSAGRGRLGRTFLSPDGGLYISFAIRMDGTMTATAKAAVAVAEAVKDTFDIDLKIKWLNDMLLGGRKVAGILAEGFYDRMIIGIGTNVITPQSSFSEDIRDTAASLIGANGSEAAIEAYRDNLIRCFFSAIEKDCLESYRSRLSTIGETVNVLQAGRTICMGLVTGITDSYHLMVRKSDGSVIELSTGEVSTRNQQ